MDPDVTWKMLCETLDALREQPDDTHLRAHAIGLLDILVDWISRGGFPPQRGA